MSDATSCQGCKHFRRSPRTCCTCTPHFVFNFQQEQSIENNSKQSKTAHVHCVWWMSYNEGVFPWNRILLGAAPNKCTQYVTFLHRLDGNSHKSFRHVTTWPHSIERLQSNQKLLESKHFEKETCYHGLVLYSPWGQSFSCYTCLLLDG